MGMLGVPELALIGGIIVLLFGAKKIPEVASEIGKGIKEFRKATDETPKEYINGYSKRKIALFLSTDKPRGCPFI